MFAAEVVSCSDGGGVAPRASKVPVTGRARVAKFVKSFASTFWTGTTVSWTEANGGPAALVSRDGELIALVGIGVSADGIEDVFWVMNPAKLTGFAPSRAPATDDVGGDEAGADGGDRGRDSRDTDLVRRERNEEHRADGVKRVDDGSRRSS